MNIRICDISNGYLVNESSLRNNLSGRTKTANGFKWKYVINELDSRINKFMGEEK